MRFTRNTLVILLFFIALSSCKRAEHRGLYTKGRLEYKIIYLNGNVGGFDQAMLPKKMVLEFNQELSTNSIDGFLGAFRLANIISFNRKKVTTHLKVLDKNYLLKGGRNEPMCCFNEYDNIIIKKDTTTKLIAGLKSYGASVTIPDNETTFDIFYTYDINLTHPNNTNPYKEIHGVLTDFRLDMGPYQMRFIAQKFNPDKEPDKSLRIPEEIIEINRIQMTALMEHIMN